MVFWAITVCLLRKFRFKVPPPFSGEDLCLEIVSIARCDKTHTQIKEGVLTGKIEKKLLL